MKEKNLDPTNCDLSPQPLLCFHSPLPPVKTPWTHPFSWDRVKGSELGI